SGWGWPWRSGSPWPWAARSPLRASRAKAAASPSGSRRAPARATQPIQLWHERVPPKREPHMDGRRHPVSTLSHFLHTHFLWLLLGAYALAGFVPAPGLWLRGLHFGEVAVLGEATRITVPVALLALLLLNAGLGIPAAQARRLLHSPGALAAGLAANLVVPVAFIFAVTQAMGVWHNPEEVQQILVGLALVASMPIA